MPGRPVFETLENSALSTREQARLQDHLVCSEPCCPELVEQAFGEEPCGKREVRLSAQAFPRVVVDVGADTGHVEGCEGLEARSFGQDLAKLHVVLLAASLLSRALRVAKKHPAAPGGGKAASLDGLKVAELDAAVGQDRPEKPRELRCPDDRLDPVEDPHRRLAATVLEKDHDLELDCREVDGEDALEVALLADDGVHLHSPLPDGDRKVHEVAVASAVAVNRARPAHGAPGLVAHLAGQIDVGKAQKARLHVFVHRAAARGKLRSVHGPDRLDAPALPKPLSHELHKRLQLRRRDRDALPGLHEPLLVGELRLDRAVARLHESTVVKPTAAPAYEGRSIEKGASALLVLAADLPAPHSPAASAFCDLAASADVRKRAAALFRAWVPSGLPR